MTVKQVRKFPDVVPLNTYITFDTADTKKSRYSFRTINNNKTNRLFLVIGTNCGL